MAISRFLVKRLCMEVRLLFNRLFSDPFHCIAELLFLLMLLRGLLFMPIQNAFS